MTTRIVLIGEARGAKEALLDHGFVGPSGQELARMLGQTGILPEPRQYPSEHDMIAYWRNARNEGVEIANVFEVHPQDNDIELFFTDAKNGLRTMPPMRPGKYLRPDMEHHVVALREKVRRLEPNLVIALGNTACWAMLEESKISVLRGTVKQSKIVNAKVLPTYHPAAVLRQWNLRPIVMSDFEKAKTECEFGAIRRIERWVTIEPTLAEIAEWITRPAEFYAVDIENPYKIISMIGFARSPQDALVIPFIDERKPGWNYWPTVDMEMQAWRYVDHLLRTNVPKTFQNGIYDLTHLLLAGLRPNACKDDTMLLHHALYPEMLKSLGFLGSVYSNEIAWKSMRTKGNNLKRDE